MPAPYPFDPNCREASNYIVDERHTITPRNGFDFNYIIPDYAPFFTRDFKIYTRTNLGAKQYFVEGTDYVFGFRFIQATQSTGLPLYGSVSFINRQFAGDVWLEYRTLGGVWNLTTNKIVEIIATWEHNPVVTTWEQVANLPYRFPPTNHTHQVEDLTTVRDLIVEIRKLSANNQQLIEGIVNNVLTNQLRNIDKSTIGLDKVRNLDILPVNQGSNNTDTYYVTPRGVREIIDNAVTPRLDAHIQSTTNSFNNLSAGTLNAYTKEEANGLLDAKLGKTEKAEDTKKIDGKTPEEYKLFVLEGTSGNTAKFNNLSYSEMVDDLIRRLGSSPGQGGGNIANLAVEVAKLTARNANQFDNKTPIQFRDWLKDNLFGKPLAEYENDLKGSITLLGGKSVAEIVAEAKKDVDATQLNGRSLSMIYQDINTLVANAPNALKFNNKTFDEAREEISSYSLDAVAESFVVAGTGVRQDEVNRTGQTFTNVVKIGKENGKKNVAVSLDDTDLGNFFLNRLPLTASTNLNDLKADEHTGIYHLANGVNPISTLNYPSDKKGTLMVLPSSHGGLQMYFPEDDNKIFKRYVANATGQWSNWESIAGGSEVGSSLKLSAPNTTSASLVLAPTNTGGSWAVEQTNNRLSFVRKNSNAGNPTGSAVATFTLPDRNGTHQLATSTDVVNFTDEQNIGGKKTFRETITGNKDLVLTRNESTGRPEVLFNDTSVNLTNIPSNKTTGRFLFNAGTSNRGVAAFSSVIHTDRTASAILSTYNTANQPVNNLRIFSSGNTVIGNASDDKINRLQVDGTILAATPENTANNNQVATTAWVRALLSSQSGAAIIQAVKDELIDSDTGKFKQSLMPPAKWS